MDLLQVMKEFHTHGRIPRGGNSSFIVLIPKKEEACSLDEFRPISLITSLYKVMAKILANRLRLVMDSIVSDNQSAFIGGRFILDGVVILNEAIAEAKKRGKGRIVFKIDFAKAYDSVEWDFLDIMMDRLNFDPLWRKWIRGCISSASANVLVNGSPSGEFSLERGLRQGDPLSPFLFLIAAEGLHSLISRAVDRFLVQPAVIGRENLKISHLQYADDTIFLLGDDEDNAGAVKNILKIFQLLSGLSVNFNKSTLLGIEVDDSKVERMAVVLGCKVWRYLNGEGRIWARVVRSIHGEVEWGDQGPRCSGLGRSGFGWWPKIVAVGGDQNSAWFAEKVRRKLGNGGSVKFWSHIWAGSTPLKHAYPRLFHMSTNKEAMVSEMGKWEDGRWEWKFNWRRELLEREKAAVEDFLQFITNFVPSAGILDSWSWCGAKDGCYSTKEAYEAIRETRNEVSVQPPLEEILQKVWGMAVPHKAMFHPPFLCRLTFHTVRPARKGEEVGKVVRSFMELHVLADLEVEK
ncbi:uncharacterized protein LOC131023524 [Salvia miltiorrhiza]|uniref:uncharacterized protein LOC131023524 n=1 Tax=Salvia miltiorrhiza TaxID=226208 RepID=UPI0025AC84DB|nr:uncharacterized protein LOC131023524 [Salvia miltiorrhiza]